MPYISRERRVDLTRPGFTQLPGTPGELNYMLTKICLAYDGGTYTTYNDVIGALECVKQEFYRRAVVPYEDDKIKENGDVY